MDHYTGLSFADEEFGKISRTTIERQPGPASAAFPYAPALSLLEESDLTKSLLAEGFSNLPVREEADPENSFRMIAKFDGVIVKRGEDSFFARIQDKHTNPENEVEFGFDELSTPSEAALVVEGAPIVWVVGKRVIRGTLESSKILYVRRIQARTEAELEKQRIKVRTLLERINWATEGQAL